MNPFEHLIADLGKTMNLPLTPDEHLACRLKFSDEITVQIDLDRSAEKILLGAELGKLTPGKYREQIFLQAMKVNGLLGTPRGILAYSSKKHALALFQYLQMDHLTGEKLFQYLTIFHDHALVWSVAIERAEIPEIQQETAKSSGFYGLRP